MAWNLGSEILVLFAVTNRLNSKTAPLIRRRGFGNYVRWSIPRWRESANGGDHFLGALVSPPVGSYLQLRE
jgi:hypothetical protein